MERKKDLAQTHSWENLNNMSEKEELFPSNFFNQANSIPVLHNLMSEKGNGRLFNRHLRGLLALHNFNWKKNPDLWLEKE